jgi:hypothetical protein
MTYRPISSARKHMIVETSKPERKRPIRVLQPYTKIGKRRAKRIRDAVRKVVAERR